MRDKELPVGVINRWSLVVGRWSLLILLLALLIALLPLTEAALLVGLSLVMVLALIDPVWALYAAVLSVPVQELVYLPGGLSYTQAMLALALGTWSLRVLAYPERSLTFGRIALGLAVLLWALVLATVATPYSQIEGVKETLRWATVALIYLLTLNSLTANHTGTTGWQWRATGLVICLLVAPAVNALVGLWQFVTASGPPGFEIAGGRFVRAYGTIGQPNSFAGYMNMAWPLALALTVGVLVRLRMIRSEKQAALHAALVPGFVSLAGLVGVLLAALGASFSRGGWVGAVAGGVALWIAITVFLRQTLRWRIWQWVGVASASALLFLAVGGTGLLPNIVVQRIDSITRNLRLFDVRTVEVTPENFAVVERMAHLQAGWAMVNSFPLTGVGPGNYTLAYEGQGAAQPFAIDPWYTSRGHTHNYYLHMAAEAGLAGVLAYMLLLGLLARQAYVTLRRSRGWFWRSVAVGGCGVIAAMAVHNMFENLHVLNMGVQLGALWGLLTAIEKNFTLSMIVDRRTSDTQSIVQRESV